MANPNFIPYPGPHTGHCGRLYNPEFKTILKFFIHTFINCSDNSQYSKILNTSCLPKRPIQTAQTQIRLLLQKLFCSDKHLVLVWFDSLCPSQQLWSCSTNHTFVLGKLCVYMYQPRKPIFYLRT